MKRMGSRIGKEEKECLVQGKEDELIGKRRARRREEYLGRKTRHEKNGCKG